MEPLADDALRSVDDLECQNYFSHTLEHTALPRSVAQSWVIGAVSRNGKEKGNVQEWMEGGKRIEICHVPQSASTVQVLT